jgi:hypothetical protein
MTITTQNCKDFIINISPIIGENSNEKWNRIKKYTFEQYILRDFKNSVGRIVTIAQYNQNLFLYKLGAAVHHLTEASDLQEVEVPGMHYVGHKAKKQDLQKFISLCVKQNSNIVSEDAYADAINPYKWDLDWDFIPVDEEDYEIKENYLYYSINNDYILNWDIYKIENISQFAYYIELADLYKIHCVFMPDHDTAYRISIYETNDHYLYLGLNNSD